MPAAARGPPVLPLQVTKSRSLAVVVCTVSPLLSWLTGLAARRSAAVQRELLQAKARRQQLDCQLLGTHLRTVRACPGSDSTARAGGRAAGLVSYGL